MNNLILLFYSEDSLFGLFMYDLVLSLIIQLVFIYT